MELKQSSNSLIESKNQTYSRILPRFLFSLRLKAAWTTKALIKQEEPSDSRILAFYAEGKTTQIKEQQRSGIRTHHEAATETHLHCKL